MKQYLIVDLQSDYKELFDFNDIKHFFTEELKGDIFNNYEEKEIVVENVKILCSLANNEMCLNEIKEELECYNYKIIDLLDLQRDLEDIKGYFLDKEEYVGAVCETIDKINKEVNK